MSKHSRFSLSILFVILLLVTLASCKNQIVTYTITYDGNGNTSGRAPESQKKPQGQDITIASNNGEGNLKRTGMYVSGWNTSADGTGTTYAEGETYSLDHDLPLYAMWDSSYLTFSSDKSFKIGATKNWDGTLQYSTNASTWNDWDGSTITSEDNKLYLRGTGNTVITESSGTAWSLTATDNSKISCTGNIENLLNWETLQSGNRPSMEAYCFYAMFRNCSSLNTAPTLASTTLASNCYSYMFENCTSLTTSPALPATTLTSNCYSNMFQNCTSLTTPPALPATTLTSNCYSNMFQNCTSLTASPALPATTLDDFCYSYLFDGCVALSTAPVLPATTLDYGCYYGMFCNCKAITTAPTLPATTLAEKCYDYMFFGCSKLDTIPALQATTAKTSCYQQMFQYCSALKLSTEQTGVFQTPFTIHITETEGAEDWDKDMFKNIGQTITGDPVANTTYYTSNTVISQ